MSIDIGHPNLLSLQSLSYTILSSCTLHDVFDDLGKVLSLPQNGEAERVRLYLWDAKDQRLALIYRPPDDDEKKTQVGENEEKGEDIEMKVISTQEVCEASGAEVKEVADVTAVDDSAPPLLSLPPLEPLPPLGSPPLPAPTSAPSSSTDESLSQHLLACSLWSLDIFDYSFLYVSSPPPSRFFS